MNKLIIVTFILSAICDQNFSNYRKVYREHKNENKVIVLNKDNFQSVLDNVDRVLVEFYAPWCNHCKELAPVYSSIAQTLQTQEKQILITKLNAHEEKELASQYQIKGYPTLILFNQGQQEKYEGPLKEKDILNWLNRKINRKARQIFDLNEFQKMQKKKLSILYIFPEQNKQSLRRLQQVAQYFDMLPMFYTFNKDIKKEVECENQYCLFVYRNFDDGLRAMKNKDQFQVQSMIQFIDNLRYPYVEELGDEVLQRYIHRNESVMVYFGEDQESDEYNIFKQFARENNRYIKFASNFYQSELNDVIADFADVKNQELPTVRILKLSPNNIDKYKVENITKQSLRQSLDQFNKNELDAIYKSEDIPNQNNSLIKKLVGKNFEDIIQNDKFVFVDMYAPECEECMQLQEIYKQLAEEYNNNNELEFYQIDVSKNEHPKLKIQGLPTFRLYKPNKKEHKEYDGPRTYDEIKAFIDIELNEEDIDTDI